MPAPNAGLACLTPEAINNRFLASTDTFTDIFFRQTLAQDEWKGIFKQIPFPTGIGFNPAFTRTFQNVPVGDLEMTAIGPSDCTDSPPYSSCDPGSEYVPLLTQEKVTLTMYQSPVLRTPSICFKDLWFDHESDRVIALTVEDLMWRTRWYWNRLAIKNLQQGVGNQVVVAPYSDGSLPGFNTNTIPAIAATQHIVVGVTDQIYTDLQQKGVKAVGLGENAQPIYNLYIGSEASRNYIRQSPDVRQDFRAISAGGNAMTKDVLLSGPQGTGGVVIGGFRHNLLRWPMRFDFVTGHYVERLPFSSVGACATIGGQSAPSSAWLNADYEAAFVIGNDEVMQWLTIPSQRAFGKATFGGPGTPNYAADFTWVNFQTDCNVFKNKGYFAAELTVGHFFPFPQYGYAIYFKRCPSPIGPYICSVNGVPSCETPSYASPPADSSPSPCPDACLT